LFGGLTENSVVITGDKLNNSQTLMQIGKEFQKNLIPIGECKEKILKQLFNLSENGPTALGPAVLASIGICDILGSKKMIICTDGLSNIGIGSLDELHTNEEKEESRQTYEGFGIEAQSKGIAISVLSIKGSDTRIETLGKLCEITGGSIERVEPTEITKNFSGILAQTVLATHVSCKVILYKGLFIREGEEKKTNVEGRDIGNVTSESQFSIEYGVLKEMKQELQKLKEIPFQIQIRYTKLDGQKNLRTINKKQPITTDRLTAEQEVNLDVLQTNAVQTTGNIASKGEYENARFRNIANKQLFNRVAKKTEEKEKVSKFENNYGQKIESAFKSIQKKRNWTKELYIRMKMMI